IEMLKSCLEFNRKVWKDLEIFIERYLGAKFLSQAFINYLLRLIHHYNRMEEIIEKITKKGWENGNEKLHY
ncbi:MAG: hypothetical protein J7L07_10140, partial [Candidatus Odinarchaeota archaeon]|nr:hypothetical protein [Candidatus Odinarchaeota archaeon]